MKEYHWTEAHIHEMYIFDITHDEIDFEIT